MNPKGISRAVLQQTKSEAVNSAYEKLSEEEKQVINKIHIGVIKSHPSITQQDLIEIIGKCGIFLTERGWI
jgi:hypothetical protein